MPRGRAAEGRLRDALEGFRDLLGLATVDLLAVAFLLGPVPRIAVLDTVVTLGFLCVLPGYALTAALVPDPARAGRDDWQLSLSGFERAAFAVAGSVALVMVTGGALAFSPYGLNRWTVAYAVGVLTITLAVLAASRRVLGRKRDAAPDTDASAAPDTSANAAPDTSANADTNADPDAAVEATAGAQRAGNGPSSIAGRDDVPDPFAVVLVLLCLLAAVAVGGVVLAPAEEYTEASVLSRADDGALRADAHPDGVAAGDETPFWVRLSNHEGRSNLYTVVVRAERVDEDGTTVASARELDRFTVAIPVDATRTERHDVRLSQPGQVRLQVLVYEDAPPSTPRPANADHALHVWLSVEAADTDGGGQ